MIRTALASFPSHRKVWVGSDEPKTPDAGAGTETTSDRAEAPNAHAIRIASPNVFIFDKRPSIASPPAAFSLAQTDDIDKVLDLGDALARQCLDLFYQRSSVGGHGFFLSGPDPCSLHLHDPALRMSLSAPSLGLANKVK